MAGIFQELQAFRLAGVLVQRPRFDRLVQLILRAVRDQQWAGRDPVDDPFRREAEQEVGGLQRDAAAEIGCLVQFLADIAAGPSVEVKPHDVPRVGDLRAASGGAAFAVCVNAVEQAGPRDVVVGIAGGPGAVSYAVEAGHCFDPGVVGGLGDDHAAAEAPAHQREPAAVYVVHAGEPVHGSAHVFDPFLGDQPAAFTFGAAEPAIVEGQHRIAQRGERPGEPFGMDDLLPLVAGTGDDHRIPGPGAAVAGQVQVGVQAQPAGEKRRRPADHQVLPSGPAPAQPGVAAFSSATSAWLRWSAAALISRAAAGSERPSRNLGAEMFGAAVTRPPKSRTGAATATWPGSNSSFTTA